MQRARISYRIDDAAEMLGITRATLYRLIKSGQVPSFKIGKCRLISDDTLREFVNKRQTDSIENPTARHSVHEAA